MVGSTPVNDFKPESLSFNLRDFIQKYGRYFPFIFFAVLLGLFLAFLRIRYTDPVYQVKSSLLIKEESNYGSSDNNKFMNLFMAGGDQNLSNETEVLKSRPLIFRVVNSMNLQIEYYNKGKIRSTLLYKDKPFTLEILGLADSTRDFKMSVIITDRNKFRVDNFKESFEFSRLFETSKGKFRLIKNDTVDVSSFGSNNFIIIYNSIPTAIEQIVTNIKIQRVQDFSRILEISLSTGNIALGKDIVDQLMKEYAKANIEDKNRIAVNTLNFIDDRLDSLGSELGGVETNLQSFRVKNQAIDLEQQSGVYFDNLKETEGLLQKQAINIQIIEYLTNYIQNSQNIYKIVPSNLGIQEPTLIPLFGEYNSKILEREALLQNTPEQNIIIQNLNVQIAKIRSDILENLNNVKQSYLISKRDLERRSAQMRSQVQSVPGKAKGLLEITRQQKIKEELFLFLLQKKEETAIMSASTISSSKVVEPAIASAIPVKPDRAPIYLLYFLVSLIIPISVIVIIELLNDKVTSKREVEKMTAAPILGEVGHSTVENSSLAFSGSSRTIVAEQFRMMRTSMRYLLKDTQHPVVLVSSTFSGEGKSFVATNLAAVMALTGKRTVILEFDIRKPKILEGFNLKGALGITNFIVGNSSVEDIVLPIKEVENLFVIPCGPIPPNPAELLLDEKIEYVFEYCKKNFDIVIVDSAPAGLVSDALILSRFSNCCLYIVRQNYTYKKQIEFIEELYSSKKFQQLALIINDVKGKGNNYGYGYGGYGYGYGYYDEKPVNFYGRMKRLIYGIGSKRKGS